MTIYNNNRYDILRRPLITEKTHELKEKNKHVFVVSSKTDKSLAKKAVEEIFHVKVDSVNIIVVNKRRVKFKGRYGMKAGYKKALVTLQIGEKLELSKWRI